MTEKNMSSLEDLITHSADVESKLGYTFHDKAHLGLAFVHRSFVNENKRLTDEHNERLEFLGDAVLGLIISDYLYTQLPLTPEGELSHLRSRLVESSSCYAYMQKLDLECYLLLGKGERRNDGRGRESILADLFEAIIGAIYIDGGIEACRQFLFDNFSSEIEDIVKRPVCNWKAELQNYSQRHFQHPPSYVVLDEQGPDHSKVFTVAVSINDQQVGVGKGNSKKEAQQEAAADALNTIQEQQKFPS